MNVMVGVDLLDQLESLIYCLWKVVMVQTPSGGELIIQGEGSKSGSTFCFTVRANKYLKHDCEVFLAYVIDNRDDKKETITKVPVVCEFPYVFPEDLPGVLPERQVEFMIALVPGEAPIAKAPYHHASPKMQELSNELQDLMDRGFFRPSSSSWGSLIFFLLRRRMDRT